MKRRILMSALLLTLIGAAVFATGGAESSSAAAETPKSITAFLDTTFLTPEIGQAEFCAKYQELTGIELIVIQPPHNEYYDKVQLSFASGDMADVYELETGKLTLYVNDGVIADLTDLITKSKVMANYSQDMLESVRYADGNIYSVGFNSGGGCPTYVRGDWLTKLKIPVPKTWDDYYKMLVAFRDQDPDGNGVKDTIPYTAPGVSDDMYLRDIMQDAELRFQYKNGKWVDGYAQPEMIKGLERLQKCYAEGLIDKEIFTNKTSTCREKFYAGNVGIFTYWAGQWNETLQNNVQKGPAGASATVIPIPAIAGSHYNNRIAVQNAITVDANVPFVFKNFIEYMHDGGQGQMLFVHGAEGVHYNMVEGKLVKLPTLNNPSVMFQKAYTHIELQPSPMKDPYELPAIYKNSIDVFYGSAKQDKLLPVSDTYLKVGGDLVALQTETVSKIAIGDMTVADGIKRYLTEAEKLGMSKILAELNK